MTIANRLALADALGVVAVWALLFTAFAMWKTRVAALGSLSIGSFMVVVVFWRVRRAYRCGAPNLFTAIVEGQVWGVMLATVMQSALWALWLDEGHDSLRAILSSGAPLVLLREASIAACAGALVAVVLWTSNHLALRRIEARHVGLRTRHPVAGSTTS